MRPAPTGATVSGACASSGAMASSIGSRSGSAWLGCRQRIGTEAPSITPFSAAKISGVCGLDGSPEAGTGTGLKVERPSTGTSGQRRSITRTQDLAFAPGMSGITRRSRARVHATYHRRSRSRAASASSASRATRSDGGTTSRTTQCTVSSAGRWTNGSRLRNRVAVFTGITTGHSRPLALWIVTISTASPSASMRPSFAGAPSFQSRVTSRANRRSPRTP